MEIFRVLWVSVLALAIYMLLYRLLIRGHCSFNGQRLALMLILFSVLVLPFLHMNGWTNWTADLLIQPIEMSNFEHFDIENWATSNLPIIYKSFIWADLRMFFYNIYWVGWCLFWGRLMAQCYYLYKDIHKSSIIVQGSYKYVLLERQNVAAVFFNYIFISKDIWYSEDSLLIVQHEQIHVQQWHSIDRILVEILCVFQWFNPFIYWFRKDLIAVHEYLAGQKMIASGVDAIAYQQLIVKYVERAVEASLQNQFNHSLTFKRITMITQYNKFKNRPFYRFLLLIPVFLVIFCLVSFQGYSTTVEVGAFILPIQEGDFKVTSGYGMRMHPIKKIKKLHTGVDFSAPIGTAVLAVERGKITRIERKETGYGKNIVLTINDEYSVLYAHLDDFAVEVGEVVEQGRIIGTVGMTGVSMKPHLHFEVIQNGKKIDPKERLPVF